jgi:pilus assembly protein Flp/PilA
MCLASCSPAGPYALVGAASCECEGASNGCNCLSFLQASGATAIEYALIAGFVSIVIVAATLAIGTTLNGTFTNVAGAIK